MTLAQESKADDRQQHGNLDDTGLADERAVVPKGSKVDPDATARAVEQIEALVVERRLVQAKESKSGGPLQRSVERHGDVGLCGRLIVRRSQHAHEAAQHFRGSPDEADGHKSVNAVVDDARHPRIVASV